MGGCHLLVREAYYFFHVLLGEWGRLVGGDNLWLTQAYLIINYFRILKVVLVERGVGFE